MPPFLYPHTHSLVLQQTSNCGNSYIWFRVCGCQNSNRTNYGPKVYPKVLGVPIKSKSYMFGDNRSVVTSATLPHSTLSKRHNILAFHRVREAIVANIIDFHWIQSDYNLSGMLSKHWEHIKVFPMIQQLLITCGPITLIPRQATEEVSKPPKYWVTTSHPKTFTIHSTPLHITYKIIIHVKAKVMPHPPSEGSNRSLPHCTLLVVSWQMYHAWNTHGISARVALTKPDYVTCGTVR